MASLPPRIIGEIICPSLLGTERNPASVVWSAQLLPGKAYARRPPHHLDLREMNGPRKTWLKGLYRKQVEPASACHIVELREALVFGQGSVVLADGQILHDSIREFLSQGNIPDEAVATPSGFDLPPRDVRRLTGRSLLVKRPWYQNPGHWLVDLMPHVPLCTQSGIHFDTILYGAVPDGSLKNLMLDVARAFSPAARVEFVRDDEQLRCETLLFIEPIHVPPHFKHPVAIQAAVDACKIVSGYVEREAPKRRLYVSRQRAGSRVIIDAEPLEALLAANGFESIFLEDMNLCEQIDAFEHAELVVGVKGAGLTNVMFCRPGTRLLVLSPADFPDVFFWDLAAQRGIDYAEIFFGDIPAPSEGGRSNFSVDPDRVETYLKRII